MALAATCDCGGEVWFTPDEDEPTPIYADCEDCGATFQLSLRRLP